MTIQWPSNPDPLYRPPADSYYWNAELEKMVDKDGFAVAVSLYPTTIEQVMQVADAGAIMPPKSTWFEPKLRSGLFVHVSSRRPW